ncbi:pentatricopeptide repeat-containing protein At4g13650-like [Dioscorea cayenensis subsp. rotundata]|uniref:Pentatricopeptide repeat-containing protein At4g13650-like n=1 Tax=Dioscorea cayennensis subsp. rotundata TaxID=55577 RepID=A0AB40BV19_DIOCR|nr:pentatricopeptide repeat-containing protein At4g13650-like [Dioscorea cayenensis subsp. rotundata]
MAPTRSPLANLPEKLSSYLKLLHLDTRSIHGLSLKLGCLSSTFLCNNLLHSYSSIPSLFDAHKLLDEIPHPNIVSFSALISGYARIGNLKHAMNLFKRLQCSIIPNKFTFGGIISGCAQTRDFLLGVQVHCGMIKSGVESDAFVQSLLIDMYGKCGMVDWAFKVDMVCSGVQPVIMTFASLVKVFDDPTKLNQAKQTHGFIVKLGIEVDDRLGSTMIAMYGRCGGINEVIRLSDRLKHDVVSLTSLLAAYMHNGFAVEAIGIFRRMVSEKMVIDLFVVASVIKACSNFQQLRLGKEVHGYAVKNGFMYDVSVSNAVLTLYGRCGAIRESERVFELMLDKDTISWTALLMSFCQNGYGEKAVLLFRQMLREALSTPIFSVTGAVSACSTIPSPPLGQQIHSRTVKLGIDEDISVENSLITMYAKCGSIENATKVFDSMQRRDTVSWNALINGFSHHGFEKEALKAFDQMQEKGIQPDDLTFVGILVSCSRAGLVTEGCEYFNLMSTAYRLMPKKEHYACMVDLFGRAGMVEDAIEFIHAMPCEPDQLVWEPLLASCKVHGNVELAKLAAMKILKIKPDEPSVYVTLSSVHASDGIWDEKARVRDIMSEYGVHKMPGRSWIEFPVSNENELEILQAL